MVDSPAHHRNILKNKLIGCRSAHNQPVGWGGAGEAGEGFTIVELLVSISIILTLVATSVAALSGVRESAQSIVGLTNVRRLVNAQTAYAFTHDSWFAGPNTSGARGIVTHGRAFEGNTSAATPTSTHDWISPTLGDELALSPNRAERTTQIFDILACPRARANTNVILWGGSHDQPDFERVLTERGFAQISYLSPAAFHYRSAASRWTPRYLAARAGRPLTAIPRPFQAPAGYRPRRDSIARPEAKVLVADGTRYLTEQRGPKGTTFTLDFDVSPTPTIYGSFTSAGPMFHRSRAYGRAYLTTADINVDLSMRYFDRQMHAAFFDGHAERLGYERVWADPTPWYPRGSTFSGGEATPEIIQQIAANPQRYWHVP